MKKDKIFLLGIMILLLPSLVLANQHYTPSFESDCNVEGICVATKYSGTMFTEIDNEWKSLSDIATTSWVASDRAFLVETDTYSFNIKPYAILNGNKIPFNVLIGGNPTVVSHGRMESGRFDTKFAVNLTNLPIGLQNQISAFGYEIVEMVGITSEDIVINDNALIFDNILKIDFTDLIDNGMTIDFISNTDLRITDLVWTGDAIDLDPVIHLDQSGSENMADAMVLEGSPTTNYGTTVSMDATDNGGYDMHDLIRWNVSMFPPAQSILDAQYCLWMNSNNLDGDTEGFNVTTYLVYSNYTWTETGVTWNTRPDSFYCGLSGTDFIQFDGTNTPSSNWYCWDVTDIISYAYENSYNNVTIYSISSDTFGSLANTEKIDFRTREFLTVADRPFLNVTYEAEDQQNPQWYDPSTNTTLVIGETVEFRTRWVDDNELDSYIFSYDNGTGTLVNTSLIQFEVSDCVMAYENCWSNETRTLPSEQGQICWKYYAHDEYNKWNATDTFCFNTTEDPILLNETHNETIVIGEPHRITSWYTNQSVLISDATLDICFDFPSFDIFCDLMAENVTGGYYYYDYIYDGTLGGIGTIEINASKSGYSNKSLDFLLTVFDTQAGIRFWNEENMTTPYINEFMWVYLKPDCTPYETLQYAGLIDQCSNLTYHGKYINGTATVDAYAFGLFEVWALDGSVEWDCATCPPIINSYRHHFKVAELDIQETGVITRDYLWDTEYSSYFAFDYDWDFWKSVLGLLVLLGASIFFAWLTENWVATAFGIIIVYILLKLFSILTGAIFFGVF